MRRSISGFPCFCILDSHFIVAGLTLPVHLWHASKTVLDVRLYVLGEEVARVTLDGGAISPNQDFSKFQAMSVLLTGFQIKKWGLAIRLSESSEGAGSDFLRNVKRGCSFSPFTSTLSNMSPLNSKPLPGLTCFSRLTISSPPPFSWCPN